MISCGPSAVARRLLSFIRESDLEPGDRLPTHEELSRRLGVGLLPLREGLGILEQHGLVVTRRRGGTVVCEPLVEGLEDPISWHLEHSGYRFEDMVRARAAMEAAVAAEAACVRTAKDQLAILETIERLEGGSSRKADRTKADEDFHLAILKAAHNPVLLVFGRLIDAQFRRKAKALREPVGRASKALAEHRAVLDAIEKRDPDEARARMRAHILGQLEGRR